MIHLLKAFFWLELQLYRQYRWALFTQFLQFMIFLVIFARLPLEKDAGFGGVPYIQYLLTGLVFQIFYEAILNGPTGRLSELQLTGQLQLVLSAPYPRWLILLGSGIGSSLTGILRAAIVLVAGAMIFDARIEVSSWPLLFGAIAYTAALSACLALFNVAGALLWPRVNLTSFFSSLLLGLLSGVFVPIDRLPSVLQPIALVNPLRFGLDVFRSSFSEHSPVPGEHWLFAAAAVIVLALVASGAYRHADRVLTRENRYQNF